MILFFSQLFGLSAMISLFISYQRKKRKDILLLKCSADFFWVLHYAVLGAYAGMIPNFLGIFRELLFVNKRKNIFFNNPFIPTFFILATWLIGFSTFNSFFNVLPIVASSFVTIALWINDTKLTKIILIPVCLSFLVYNAFIHSFIGVLNEIFEISSILIFFVKGENKMNKNFFSQDVFTIKPLLIAQGEPIKNAVKTISDQVSTLTIEKGKIFAQEIEDKFISDFEKPEDKMAHVSTFLVIDGTIYVSYYANTKEPSEDPENQTARLAFCPLSNPNDKTFIDLQTVGSMVGGKKVEMVYDTILMQKNDEIIFVMWTARVKQNYYRFYCPFNVKTKKLGKIGVNKFKVGDVINDFSTSGIKSAMAENGLPIKKMFSDIGIMQKLSSRIENGKTYYYTGAYSGDFTCIIKSQDLITWEYVSQPDFVNNSMWENATFALGDKCYYFVRQQLDDKYGFLTAYNFCDGSWDAPVLINDCQSRSDFILYNNQLFLFHAPIDREHIGIVKIDKKDISKSEVVLQAKMHTSCFYPFIQYFKDGQLAMSYTVQRQHIRLAQFNLSKYL